MTHTTPCQQPTSNPDDWFIGKDGRQFSDIDENEPGEIQLNTAMEDAHLDLEDLDAVEVMFKRLTASNTRDALARRRHAKEACHTSCYFRNDCLRQALDEGHVAGTWGGYYEEELREIRREIARRKSRKPSTTDA